MFQVEHEFTLPVGFLDEDGTLHREGTMRLATAADEILPLQDPRVQRNPAYLTVILLSPRHHAPRTARAGDAATVESLFAADLAFLQDLYNTINDVAEPRGQPDVACPSCGEALGRGPRAPGGIRAYPVDRLRSEMAFLAYHLHWPLAELMDLPHRERRSWVGEVSAINTALNAAAQGG